MIRRGPAAALVALTVLGVAAAGPTGSDVAVSRLEGPQNEPVIAIDPSDSRVLLAGSNSFAEGTMRVYGSADGGRSWQADTVFPAPSSRLVTCAADPSVAIDLNGRQFFSFIRSTPCGIGRPRLYVAARAGPEADWETPVLVAPLGRARFDDKPWIAVDASRTSRFRNRLYATWTRFTRNNDSRVMLASSDDGGATWSPPVLVSKIGSELSYANVAVSRNGSVYVAWDDSTDFHVQIARSTDGGRTFGPERTAAAFSVVTIPRCGSGFVIPALRLKCTQANPQLAIDTSDGRFRGRVYLTYLQTEFYGNQGVRVSVLDSRLKPLAGYPLTRLGVPVALVRRSERRDQFWPQSAVDSSTGALWVCFYDTKGDPRRRRARYSCTASVDGGARFAAPVAVASVASDATQKGADPREYGDYEGLAAARGVARPIWTDTRDLESYAEEIYTASLTLADLRR